MVSLRKYWLVIVAGLAAIGLAFSGIFLRIFAGMPLRESLGHDAAEVVIVNATEWLVVASALAAAATFAAVVVALWTAASGERVRQQERRDADNATAQLVGLKTFLVFNRALNVHDHLWAPYDGPPLGFDGKPEVWRTIQPLLGVELEDGLNLTAAEMVLLVRMGQATFLTDLLLATARYRNLVMALGTYAQKSEEFQAMTPPPVAMTGRIGTIELSQEDVRRLAPYAVALEHLVINMREMSKENLESCTRLSKEFHPMMKAAFPDQKFISIQPLEAKEKPRADAGAEQRSI
jgi:hypothetical protein